jgi:hypothetical protein
MVVRSGFVPITQMMRYGIMLDIFGFFVIVGMVLLLGPFVLCDSCWSLVLVLGSRSVGPKSMVRGPRLSPD